MVGQVLNPPLQGRLTRSLAMLTNKDFVKRSDGAILDMGMATVVLIKQGDGQELLLYS